MKVDNQTDLQIAWLVGQVRPPGLAATLIVKGSYRLSPEVVEPSETPEPPGADRPYEGTPASVRYESDFAPFKPRADILLVGACHVPKGGAVRSCRVGLEVGSLRKTLLVVGDRQWMRERLETRPSDPVPFTTMPIGYDRAFGGIGFEANPLGRGFDRTLLPNVEDPRRLLESPNDLPEPAGFGPISRSWPQRARLAGSYRDPWRRERWPWPPEDFDWSYYNAAPRDQQIDGYLVGNERIALEHLCPEAERLETSLPGIRPQVFLVEQSNGTGRFVEAALQLDTLWIDAENATLVLLWRGLAPVRTLKMEEVAEIHLAAQPLSQAGRTVESYRAECLRKQIQRDAVAEKEAETEREEDRRFEEEFARMEAEILEVEKQADAHSASGLRSLFDRGLKSPPVKTEAQAIREAASVSKSLLEQAAHVSAAFAAPAGFEPSSMDEELAGLPPEDLPWNRKRFEEHALAKGSFSEQDLSGLDLSGLDLSGLDLTKADLSAANLAHCRLTHARLEGANFSRADLTSTDLSGAVLTGADLTRAMMEGCQLVGARLERSLLCGARMDGSDLHDAVGDHADFTGVSLRKARLDSGRFIEGDFSECALEGADFRGAVLRQARFEGSKAPGVLMDGADLEGLRAGGRSDFTGGIFRGARADGSCWEGATLDRADFEVAWLRRAVFVSARLRGARFVGADMAEARFDDADLEGAKLGWSNIFRGSFERAVLRKADLSQANLYEVEFWDAVMEGADTSGANLKMTKLES
jgi:uncharacterized protein YjbI with pentapeptide repeats